MARVVRTLALGAFLAFVVAPDGGVLAQTKDAKDAQPAAKRSGLKKAKTPQETTARGEGSERKAADAATVQKSLDAAQKALDSNKPDQAVNQINSLIAAGGLDARSMARALAVRGVAYRKQGKPAQAISDLQSALHLRNGLNDAERAAAIEARAAAYREAGLGEPPALAGGKQAPTTAGGAAKTASGSAAGAPKATSAPLATSAAPSRPQVGEPQRAAEPAPTSGGGIGGLFSSLFGGATSAPAKTEASPARAPADPALSSWSRTEVSPTGAKAASVVAQVPKKQPVAAQAPATAAPAAATPGGHRIQLTAFKSQEEARALAERVSRDFRDQIGARAFDIGEARFGGAIYYRPQFGTFATLNEAKYLCARIRATGVDCLVSP